MGPLLDLAIQLAHDEIELQEQEAPPTKAERQQTNALFDAALAARVAGVSPTVEELLCSRDERQAWVLAGRVHDLETALRLGLALQGAEGMRVLMDEFGGLPTGAGSAAQIARDAAERLRAVDRA